MLQEPSVEVRGASMEGLDLAWMWMGDACGPVLPGAGCVPGMVLGA